MLIGVVVGLVSGTLTCLVTEIYCHRCVAHRAFQIHPRLASFLDGFMQVYGGVHPQRWAGVHRLHHRYADTPLDPHSPLERHPVLVLTGTPYLFAKARWRLPADSSPAPGMRHFAVRILITSFWLLTIGLAPTLTAVAVHLVCYLGIMGMVNTFGHRTGSKPHPDVPGYDSPLLALPLLGHGYHNSHHAHPAAARMGLLDPMWPIVRLLSRLGMVVFERQPAATHARGCCMASVSLAPGRSTRRRPHGAGVTLADRQPRWRWPAWSSSEKVPRNWPRSGHGEPSSSGRSEGSAVRNDWARRHAARLAAETAAPSTERMSTPRPA